MEIFQTGSRAEKVARMFSILPFKLTLHEIMIYSCLLLHLLYTQTTNYIYLYKFIHICLPCSYHLHRAMCHGWNNAIMLADPVCGLPWAIIGGREGGREVMVTHEAFWEGGSCKYTCRSSSQSQNQFTGGRIMQMCLQTHFVFFHWGIMGGRERDVYIFYQHDMD